MFTILCLMLGSSLPALGFYIPVTCPHGKKCQQALLSGNDVLLQCNISEAHWSYSGHSKDNNHPDLASIPNVATTPEGSLTIKNPLPSQSGHYRCTDKNGKQVVWYEIDFQDAASLYVSHVDLGHRPLENETLYPGGMELIFTQWEPWQACSRCEKPGERKRLGYCRVLVHLEKSIPCGLYPLKSMVSSSRVQPELQVQNCYMPCKDEYPTGGDYVIFDSFSLTSGLESTWLTCPFATIYRPVHWEVNGTPLTWHGQLSGHEISTILDASTGGGRLKVFQPATYRCFVEQELMAQFNPSSEMPHAQGRDFGAQWQDTWRTRTPSGKADSILKGLKLLLLLGSSLFLMGLLVKAFRLARSKKNNRILLVK